jgi:SAM-dependent methyltransferase
MLTDSAYERGDYDFLYENYLGKGHDSLERALRELLESSRVPEVVLDLCAGTGHFTQVLVDAGMTVLAIDKSKAMLEQLMRKIEPRYAFRTMALDLNRKGAVHRLPRADLITCRQGIGYLEPEVVAALPSRLSTGGTLLFNSFAEPPPGPWWHRRRKGIYEAGFYLRGKVYHLQARWPRVDLTSFYWHDVGKLTSDWQLAGYDVQVKQAGRTIIASVRCR